MTISKPCPDLQLRPVAAPPEATRHAKVYALLPQLDVLLDAPGFGVRNAICLPGSAQPFSPAAFFAASGRRAGLH